jgi:hypothetical protein
MGIDSIPNLYDAVENKVNHMAFVKSMLKAIFDLNQKYQLQEGVELGIFYNMTDNTKDSLLFVGDPLTLPADQAEKDSKDYRYIGTVGNVDFKESFKELVRIVDKDLGVFELNDGENIKYNQEVYQNVPKRKLKRKWPDSSLGIKADLKNFLEQEAKEEKWYEMLINTLENLIKV